MKKLVPLITVVLAACQAGNDPQVLDSGGTGAAIAVTPSTFGLTSISPNNQAVCTEPRPSAGSQFASAANAVAEGSVAGDEGGAAIGANLTAIRQADAKIAGAVQQIAAIDAADEFERVEYLSHGLFGLCQLMTTKPGQTLTGAQVETLIEAVVDASKSIPVKEEGSGG